MTTIAWLLFVVILLDRIRRPAPIYVSVYMCDDDDGEEDEIAPTFVERKPQSEEERMRLN